MIEEYFDKHKDIMNEIFMKRANLVLINKWLLTNGYSPLSEYVPYPTKRGSLSNENSKPSSPLDKGANLFRLDSIVFSTPDVGSNVRHIFLRFDLEYSWRRYFLELDRACLFSKKTSLAPLSSGDDGLLFSMVKWKRDR
jgi:hypothetical protein